MKHRVRKFFFLSCCVLAIFTFELQGIVVKNDAEIVNYMVSVEAYPALVRFSSGGHGTLISHNWIVTAAHVAKLMDENTLVITKDTQVSIEKVYIHPDYIPRGHHDIALVKTINKIENIEPFTLNSMNNEAGRNLWLLGTGNIGNGIEGEFPSSNLRVLLRAQNRVEKTNYSDIYFNFDEEGPSQLKLEGTPGNGDSGGPAFLMYNERNLILGVASRSIVRKSHRGKFGSISVYTRISTHLQWIFETINTN